MCCKKTFRVESHLKIVCIPHSFLVINVSDKGKTLCSPCIYFYYILAYIQHNGDISLENYEYVFKTETAH